MMYLIIMLTLGLLPKVASALAVIFMPVIEAAAVLLIMPLGIALMFNAVSREMSDRMLRAEGRIIRAILRFCGRIIWMILSAVTVWCATLIFRRVAPAVFRWSRNLLLRFGRSRGFSNVIGGVVTALVVVAII